VAEAVAFASSLHPLRLDGHLGCGAEMKAAGLLLA
jgi:hypothetical protein